MKTFDDRKRQEDWEVKSRQATKRQVSSEWKQEENYRKRNGQPLIVGYKITSGKNCPHAKCFEGMVFLIEDVFDEPDLLPPYEACKHDACKCSFTAIKADRVEKARVVLEFGDPKLQAKLTTRKTSPVGFENRID